MLSKMLLKARLDGELERYGDGRSRDRDQVIRWLIRKTSAY